MHALPTASRRCSICEAHAAKFVTEHFGAPKLVCEDCMDLVECLECGQLPGPDGKCHCKDGTPRLPEFRLLKGGLASRN
jgi:hypothetical protein